MPKSSLVRSPSAAVPGLSYATCGARRTRRWPGLYVHAERGARVAQLRVPDRLVAVLRDREGNAAEAALDPVAAGRELRLRRAFPGLVVVALRERGAAARGIHDDLVVVVFPDHRDLAGREVLLVALDVALVDRDERPVGRERVRVIAAGDEARDG